MRSLLVVGASITLGIGATYASFTSNSVTLANTTVTTGSANLKLCDNQSGNQWQTAISPLFNLSGLNPDQERELFSDRSLYIGNDNGQLATATGTSDCSGYGGDPVGSSSVNLRLVPNVSFTEESCPAPLPSNLKLRFEVNGIATDNKTLTSWSSNTTSVDPVIVPGQVGQIRTFVIMSSTATAQGTNCNFNISFTGKQPSS